MTIEKYFYNALFWTIILGSIIGCSKDEEDSFPEMYISIDGDVRQINDMGLTIINLSKYKFSESYDEPAGIQFVLDIYDPEKKAIGDIGNFINNEIELFVDVFSSENPPFQNKSIFPCFKEDELYDFSSKERKEFKKDKALVLLRIKTQDDDTIFGSYADSGQEVEVQYKDGEYIVLIDNITVKNIKLSVRLIIH